MNMPHAIKTRQLLGTVATGLGGILLATLQVGCPFTNQNHCALNQGACDGGLVCSMCASENNGCVASVEDSCRFGSDTDTATTDTTTSPTTLTETTLTTETTTETPTTITSDPTDETTTETTDPTDTEICDVSEPNNGDCEAPTPYCVDGLTCGDCTAVTCGDINTATPVCDAGSGMCVECLPDQLEACDAGEPICNQYTNSCSTCFEHDQCESGACDFVTNSCFPTGNTIWVEKRADCEVEDGTEANPYCELADAIEAETNIMEPIVFRVKYKPQQPHNAQIVVAGAVRLAIIGDHVEREQYPEVSSNQSQPRLEVKSGARVFVSRMEFKDSAQAAPAAISCEGNGSRVFLDQVMIRENKSPLTLDTNCGVEVRRSDISDNLNGIINDGGNLTITNTFITHNHNQDYTNKDPALTLLGTGETTVLYSMIHDSPGIGASAVVCPGSSPITIRNSIIWGDTSLEPLYGTCNEKVVTGTVEGDPPANFTDLFKRDSTEFGTYSLQQAEESLMSAGWKVGDPYTDFNGDLRPAVDDAPDYAGADLP